MTDRFNAFLVILAHDIREDDAQATINAIKQIKGVLDVQPQVVDYAEVIAESRLKFELWEKMYQIFWK